MARHWYRLCRESTLLLQIYRTFCSSESWATVERMVCSCWRHFDGSFQSHTINLSSAGLFVNLVGGRQRAVRFSANEKKGAKQMFERKKKNHLILNGPLIVYVESTMLMKQKPESTLNLQVIKKRTSHPSIDLSCDVLFSLSAHFYWVAWLFALTVHLLALLFCSLSRHFYWHQKITFLFIHRMNWTQWKKNHSLHCFES